MAHLVGQVDLTDQSPRKEAGLMAEQEDQKDQEMRLKKRSLSVASIPLHRVLERLKPPTATIVQEREPALFSVKENQVAPTWQIELGLMLYNRIVEILVRTWQVQAVTANADQLV